eukprot:1465363-Prymnesium_polylepis.1
MPGRESAAPQASGPERDTRINVHDTPAAPQACRLSCRRVESLSCRRCSASSSARRLESVGSSSRGDRDRVGTEGERARHRTLQTPLGLATKRHAARGARAGSREGRELAWLST